MSPDTLRQAEARELLDAAVARSREQCPGGELCCCCRAGCDCGCRDDCPRFRAQVLRQIKGDSKTPISRAVARLSESS